MNATLLFGTLENIHYDENKTKKRAPTYRESPVSAVFGFPANRTIGTTALIRD